MNSTGHAVGGPWSGDWRGRVVLLVRSHGFDCVMDYARGFPCLPYIHLVKQLGENIASAQFECAQFEEAERTASIRDVAIDSLLRDLHWHLPSGWEGGKQGHFATSQVYVDWLLRLDGISRNEPVNVELKGKGESLWNALETIQPPLGWLPTSYKDIFVTAAFDRAWPQPQNR